MTTPPRDNFLQEKQGVGQMADNWPGSSDDQNGLA
jgi:hypothetical protein